MKQCDQRENWCHEDCDDFINENQTETADEKRFWFADIVSGFVEFWEKY